MNKTYSNSPEQSSAAHDRLRNRLRERSATIVMAVGNVNAATKNYLPSPAPEDFATRIAVENSIAYQSAQKTHEADAHPAPRSNQTTFAAEYGAESQEEMLQNARNKINEALN